MSAGADTLMRSMLFSQFEASLCMLHDCIAKCPPEHWDGLIAKYPFWQVAYHTLCFVDLYLTRTEGEFQPRPEFHPAGMAEFDDECPSRRFTRSEVLAYLNVCRAKLHAVLGTSESAETQEILAGPAGHSRRPFSRAEMHIYNLRHVQHHAGQLSAFLRRAGVDTRWIGFGWRE